MSFDLDLKYFYVSFFRPMSSQAFFHFLRGENRRGWDGGKVGDRSNSRPIYRLERGTGEKDEKGEEGGGGQRRSDHSPKGMGKKREGGKGGRYKNRQTLHNFVESALLEWMFSHAYKNIEFFTSGQIVGSHTSTSNDHVLPL